MKFSIFSKHCLVPFFIFGIIGVLIAFVGHAINVNYHLNAALSPMGLCMAEVEGFLGYGLMGGILGAIAFFAKRPRIFAVCCLVPFFVCGVIGASILFVGNAINANYYPHVALSPLWLCMDEAAWFLGFGLIGGLLGAIVYSCVQLCVQRAQSAGGTRRLL